MDRHFHDLLLTRWFRRYLKVVPSLATLLWVPLRLSWWKHEIDIKTWEIHFLWMIASELSLNFLNSCCLLLFDPVILDLKAVFEKQFRTCTITSQCSSFSVITPHLDTQNPLSLDSLVLCQSSVYWRVKELSFPSRLFPFLPEGSNHVQRA